MLAVSAACAEWNRGISGLREFARRNFSKSLPLFFHVEAQLFHRGPIVDGEQDGIVPGGVLMVMPLPRRHSEDIALLICQALVFHDHSACAFEGEVETRAGVAVRQRFLACA